MQPGGHIPGSRSPSIIRNDVRRVLLLLAAWVLAAVAAQPVAAAGWGIQPVPKPAHSGDAELLGVSCTSRSNCFAVGFRDLRPTNDPVPLVEHWSGAAWSTEPTATSTPSGWSGWLSAVSCASRTACVAVGLSYSDRAQPGPLAERWDGSSWSIERVPHLGNAEALDGVSCASSTDCLAVGYGRSSVAAYWNGTRWSAENVRFGDPAGRPNALTSVSCSSGNCATVGWDNVGLCGQDGYDSYFSIPILGFRTDRGWALRRHPNLVCSNAGDSYSGYTVDGVSCASPVACTAVGSAIYHWDGHRWSVQAAPVDAGELRGVSCPSANACTAVGSRIYSWKGLGWSSLHIPLPVHAAAPELNGVTCLSRAWCVAVGSYVDGALNNSMLVESLGVGVTPASQANTASER